jgi:hypothetical protein
MEKLDRKDLLTTQGELVDLIDNHKQEQGKRVTKEQREASREQYELWWAELEEVKELLRQL